MRGTALARGKSVDEIACDFGARGTVPECIAQNRIKRHRALTDDIRVQAFLFALRACAVLATRDSLVSDTIQIDSSIFCF